LKVLAGELRPDSGTVRIDHQDLYDLSSRERRQWLMEVGTVFPDLKLFADKTVEENIHFVLYVKGISLEGQEDAIRLLLAKAGLGDKLKTLAQELTAAERQMLLSLRSMIFSPRLFLAEDPFRGLEGSAVAVLFRFLKELNKSGTTIVLSTRQPEFLEETKKQAEGLDLHWYQLDQGKLHPLEEKVP
jgi:cell division transport system ATP-binding protein